MTFTLSAVNERRGLALVLFGPVDTVDDQDFDETSRGLQSQSQLLLNSREYRWSRVVRRWFSTCVRCNGTDKRRAIRVPLKTDVVRSRQTGHVNHGSS